MCGICGIISLEGKQAEEQLLHPMMEAMKYRGPDDEGTFCEGSVSLGFVRLSIIDLSQAGHQPLFSDDDRYVMVFNGEIYNYIEIREELKLKGYQFNTKTDSEVLLKSYIEWGSECMHKFNGMWAFVIYDRIDKTIFIARDRYGVKPFYYYIDNNNFIFASEIPPILCSLNKKPKENNQAIFDFLVFNRTDHTESTFFEGLSKLQHGHSILISGIGTKPQISIQKWYDLRANLKEPFSNAEELRDLLSSSIGLRLRSDVPVGVCLSGGLDSSSIVSLLLQDFDKKDLSTFSAVYDKGQVGDESKFINEYNSSLKNMFFTTPDAVSLTKDLSDFVKAHAEPIPTTSPYAQFKVMQLAKGKVVVTLDGQGADEELAGYHYFFGYYFKDLLLTGRLLKLLKEVFNYLKKHHSLFGLKSLILFLMPDSVRTKVRVNEKGYINDGFISRFKNKSNISDILYGSGNLNEALLDHFEFKLEHLLKWEDRNSMFFSIESRIPFLDYRLVERSLATSTDWKIRKGTTKYILRESMKGILPEKIRNRQDKIGFSTPQAEWFREPAWQNIINECIESESFKKRNIINPEIARKQFKKHLSGKADSSKEIWKWLHLELWFRQFID